MKKVSLDDLLDGTTPVQSSKDNTIAAWDNQPGGTVVERFTEGSTKYVLVEFEKSPGQYYLYLG